MRKIACKTVCFIVVVLAFLCTQASTQEAMSTNGSTYGNHNEENPAGGMREDQYGTLQSEIRSRKSFLNGAAGGLDTKSAKAFLQKSFPRTSSATEDLDHGLDRDQYEEGGEMVGETINILNGNMVDVRTDLSFPSPHRLGFRFEAVYNSRSDVLGKSGHGWTHTYEAVAAPGAVGSGYDLKITDGTGRGHYFVRDTSLGGYRGIYQERSHVILWRTHYIWVLLDGSKYRFSTISGKLTSIEDPVGNTLALGYDSQWRLVSVTDVSSQRMIGFKYNAQGLLQEIDGPVTAAVPAVPGELYGVWVQFGYDSAGNLASVTYGDGSGFTYQYQDSLIDPHRLWRKQNKHGHLLETWDYDDQDRCIARLSNQGKGVDSIAYVSETQVDVTVAGKLRSYTIAAAGERMRVVAMIGPANAPYSRTNAIGWTYDAQTHLLSQVTFGGGTVNRYQDFDGRGNPRTVILAYGRPEQRTITYTYHPVLNTPMSRTEASVLGSGSKVTIWDYDEPTDENYNQNPTSLVRRVIETGSTLDQAGNVVSYKYTTAFGYNTKGQLTAYNPPASKIEYAILSYDSATSNLLSITQAMIGKTEFPSYDQAGYPLRMIDPNGETTDYGYDGRARITRITHSDGSFRSMIYEMGVLRTQIDEDGVSQTYDYDSNGRRSRITDQENNHIDYEYDSLGNVASMKYLSAEGVLTRWKRWSYQHPDYPGLLWKEILADPYDGASTVYEYNGAGKVETLTDFNGNTTNYAYDGFNRVASITQPGSVVTGYGYDGHGNLETLTDGEQHETVYTHDDMGRVVRVQSPDTGTTSYVYDPAGNLKTKTDARGISSTYSFDALNRLIRMSFPAANGQSGYSIGYAYDQRTNGKGRLTDILDPSGSTRFDYDSRGRVHAKTSRINGIDFTMSRSFTAGRRITRFITPAGRAIDYERSEGCACRVSRITTRGASEAIATPLFEISSYLPFGSPSAMDAGNGGSISNAFDLNGRLSTSNTGAARERQYTYYAGGSLQSITASGTPWQNRTYTYDPLNQLKDARGPYGLLDYTYDSAGNRETLNGQGYTYVSGTNRIATDEAGKNYSYDANGNITGIGNRSLIYNQKNELVRVQEGTGVLGEYMYNGLGERVIKNTGSRTYYVYDFDGNLIAESSPDGQITTEYLYQGRSRLARVDANGAIFFYHNDQLGTPQLMTDQQNMVVWEATYNPFGEAWVHSGSSVTNNFRFQGQYFDAETGFHYNYHRYYDPKTGRYLTPDPIGQVGGVNPYLYVENDPVNAVDPWGLKTWICRRPLKGFDNMYGPEFHEYFCTNDPATEKIVCGSTTPKGTNFLWSEERPTTPADGDVFNPDACGEVADDNKCMEQCMVDKNNSPRPQYGWPTAGTDCKEFTWNSYWDCANRCIQPKADPSIPTPP